MANPFENRPELLLGLEAFIAGLAGVQPEQLARLDDPSYPVAGSSGALQILYGRMALNANAMLAPPADHMAAIRANVTSRDTAQVHQGLRELTPRVEAFLAGLDGRRHSSSAPVDDRGYRSAAFIGFGPTFFDDRDTGKPRFQVPARPARLRPLRLTGDDRAGIDPRRSQADVLIALESQSYAALLEGIDHVTRYVKEAPWLELVDLHLGASRGDGRNHLGFYDGVSNPTPESKPSAMDVVLAHSPPEPGSLEGGTYLVFRPFALDMDAWAALSEEEQERIIGLRKEDGGHPSHPAEGAHALMAGAPVAPRILRRGINSIHLRPEGGRDRGLLFISFQKDPDAFEKLHDAHLLARGKRDRLLASPVVRPLASDVYFVPDHLGWGYVGQTLFEPAPFAQLFRAAKLGDEARFDEALALYRELVRSYPDLVVAYSNIADLAPDAGLIVEAQQMADAALRRSPHYYPLGGKAWAEYLTGDFASAAWLARRAIESTYSDVMRAYPYHTLGASLIELGRPKEAEVALRRAAERVNIEPVICYSLGNSLDAQQRYREAEKIYARTLEVLEYRLRYGAVNPRDRSNLFNVKYIRYTSDRNQRALAAIKRLMREVPSHARP